MYDDNEQCADCGTSNPNMFNCNEAGARLPGLLCFLCWRNKHPAFNKPKNKINLLIILPYALLVLFIGYVLADCCLL